MTGVLDVIRDIIRKKRAAKVVPVHASRREILAVCCCGSLSELGELDKSLCELKRDKVIFECHTIKDVAFMVVE